MGTAWGHFGDSGDKMGTIYRNSNEWVSTYSIVKTREMALKWMISEHLKRLNKCHLYLRTKRSGVRIPSGVPRITSDFGCYPYFFVLFEVFWILRFLPWGQFGDSCRKNSKNMTVNSGGFPCCWRSFFYACFLLWNTLARASVALACACSIWWA